MSAIMEPPPNSLADRGADPDKLRLYTRRKLAIASQLRALLDLQKKRGSNARLRRCEELMVKLAEDRFTLAVLGQFKRGKSSLMNAIIGRELLPTGVLPLTSAITVLKFGPSERLVVRREGLQFPEVVPVTALANYVTENGNPGNRKKVTAATLEVPLPFLRRGLEFVDTPGIGSAIEANTATTYSFLPECDAALFVTSIDTPLTASELDFLRAIREHVGKIFFIVNKIDLAPNERERDEVLHFIRNRLREATDQRSPRIFPVSARSAIAACDEAAQSGLEELEHALALFLSEEKSAALLNAVIGKALRIIEEEAGEVELHRRARSLSSEDVTARLDQLRLAWNELGDKRHELITQLRDDSLRSADATAGAQLDEVFGAMRERLPNDLDVLLGRGGWRLGEELAERWAGIIAQQSSDHLSNWLREFPRALTDEWRRLIAKVASFIKANLREISAHAASTFDIERQAADDVVPPVASNPVFSHQAAAVHAMRRSSNLVYWVPARLVRRTLKKDLLAQTLHFLASEREQALAAVAEAVTRMAEDFARQFDSAAAETEFRLSSAISGESDGDNAFREIEKSLLALRDGGSADIAAEAAIDREGPAKPPSPNEPLSADRTGRDLAQDLKTRGCAVCDHLVRTAFDFFAHWQYAIASEQDAQTKFASERGFCPLHMWQLHAVSSSVGESIGLARLVEEMSMLLKKTAPAEIGSILRGANNCRVCQLLCAAESDYVAKVAAFVSADAGRDAYAQSQGLCLHHLARVLPHLRNEVAQFVLQEAARHFEENAEDMQSYAIKRDALRRTLGNKDEEDAHARALIHFAGAKDVYTPWPEDREI